MFNFFNTVTWNVDPEIFSTKYFSLRYYSLFFALAFLCSYFLLKNILSKENKVHLLDKLTPFLIAGTLIGARLGHCLFYEFDYYAHHLLEIILPFQWSDGHFRVTGYQGLASHGGAIGLLISVILFCRKYRINMWWLLDRLAIVFSLTAFFIRIGNLFNSEIIGRPTSLPWAFIFVRDDLIPRHPAQLYEAVGYLLLCGLLWKLYGSARSKHRAQLFSIFLVVTFSLRFCIEFIKENQEPFEHGMVLNMGKCLSIPFILIGLILLLKSLQYERQQKAHNHTDRVFRKRQNNAT